MSALLGTEDFLTPALVFCTPGCLTLTGFPGRSLFDLGQDPQVSDALFKEAQQQWSRGWIREHSGAGAAARRATVEALPPRPAVFVRPEWAVLAEDFLSLGGQRRWAA